MAKKQTSPLGRARIVSPSGGESVDKVHFPIVVGIGASAGGLEAFIQLFKHLPKDTGMGFVIVQHLDPVHKSTLVEILRRSTAMRVLEITQGLKVEPNQVYVIPPDKSLEIEKGVLKLRRRNSKGGAPFHPINIFFESLARDLRERAIGIVLSGTASDGTLGLENIKAEDGITFAQDESAKYDSMPRSAIAAGCVDFVLSPENMASELARIARHPLVRNSPERTPAFPVEREREADQRETAGAPLAPGGKRRPRTGSTLAHEEAATAPPPPETDDYKKILLLLRNHCGVDFSLYRTPTIQRRVTRRMVLNQMDTLRAYAEFLRGNAKELGLLYSDVLISVTSFFRNPEVFEVLKSKVFPQLLEQAGRDDLVRIWTLGCSTGQEAYSMAMSFMEFAVKLEAPVRLQIFATDLNEALLEKARHGLYTKGLVDNLSAERLRRFFVEEDGGYRVIKSLREMCVFAKHNILSDPPLSRMDLISCRNLLIYIEPVFQKKILPNFHYALKPKGFLLLGASESVGSFTNLFDAEYKKERIFCKKAGASTGYQLPVVANRNSAKEAGRPQPQRGAPDSFRVEQNAQREADRILAARQAPPSVLVNADLQIIQYRGLTGAFLEQPMGKPSADLLKLARPGLMLPLRAALHEAKKRNHTVRRDRISFKSEGHSRVVNIEVIPFKDPVDLAFLILFEEPAGTSAPARPPVDLSRAKSKTDPRYLAELERELAETREYLTSVQEQSQATQEELQASNEEVQSANEELQSINEELETSKEELESTNEELTTVNEEMVNRNAELNRVNSDLNNLHVSMNTAIVVLGRDLTVRRFTPLAEQYFNLLANDLGRPLSHIKHNLDFPDLEPFIAEVISSLSVREREVRDKDGRWFVLRARPYLTVDNKIDGAVVMLIDIDALKRTEAAQHISELRYRRLFEESQDGILMIDLETRRITQANPFALELLGYTAEEVLGRRLYEIGLFPQHAVNETVFRELKEKKSVHWESLPLITKSGQHREVDIVGSIYEEDGRQVIQCNLRDVTERAAAQEAKYLLASIVESSEDSIISIDLDQTITSWNQGAEQLYGYPAREVIGKPLTMLTLTEDLKKLAAHMDEVRQGKAVESFDEERQQKDGKRVFVSVTLSAIKDSGGKVIGVSSVSREITKRKKAELALREAQIELSKHATRMEETVTKRTGQLRETVGDLEAFSYSIAHDMRAPLRGMQGFCQVLLEDYSPRLDAQGQGYLRQIEGSAQRLDRLIQDVLNYTKILKGSVALEKVELDNLVRGIIATYPGWLPPKAHVEIKGTLPPVVGNPAFLTQCVSNLISNAVKFVAPETMPQVKLWAEIMKESQVRIWFVDNGIGIAPENHHRIFGMLDQLNGQTEYEGTGIGLTIVRKAVERMGGKVGFESAPGKGSKFWIQLKKA